MTALDEKFEAARKWLEEHAERLQDRDYVERQRQRQARIQKPRTGDIPWVRI